MGEPASQTVDRGLEWIRPPQQARTREALTRLLDAAERMVAEKGFADTGIAEIAQAAGSSVGGFYRRFGDKQGLLQALHARFCDEARATADAALDPSRWAGAPTAAVVREVVAFLIQIHREREGLFRAYQHAGYSDDIVRRRTVELQEYLHAKLAALFADRRADFTHPDAELGPAFALDLMLATLTYAGLLRQSALGLHDPRLDEELPRAFLAYLGVRAD
ncbi:MAG: TetR/AcrR family transcriptional regulator [Deltaproteobacteria bacterium]|nr:TetR/AcrR family transcriptional regulator [Deltaproteobacteria bacterium]